MNAPESASSRAAVLRILYIVNKRLPSADYRVAYGMAAGRRVTFALPGRPEAVPPDRYVRADFGEGFRLRDAAAACTLLWHLVRHRRRYDLVHFFSTKLVLAGPWLARLAGLRCLVTVTGLGRVFTDNALHLRVLRGPYLLLLRGALALAERVLLQNQGDMAWIGARFPARAGKLRYVGSAVTEPAPTERSFEGPLRVLLVARLLPSKGIPDFLSVARALRHRGIAVAIAGPPSADYAALARQVADADREGVVTYRGELLGAALAEAYAAADVLLFLSHGEGMSRVMLEAGLSGLCPVAYDIPANRDLLDAEAGLLVPKGEWRRCAEVVAALEADRPRLRREAAAFQLRVRERFSLSSYAARMDGVLAELPA